MIRRSPFSLLVGLVALASPAGPVAGQSPSSFDLLIVGGQVLDGTGNPSFRADVGIVGDRIVAIGDLGGHPAAREIDARGRTVTPGFIDLHSHADGAFASDDARRRAAPNMVAQGATTLVVNQDGRSPQWPIAGQRASYEELGIGPNAILMIGHREVRQGGMGDDTSREATPREIERMRELVRQGMEEGAWGLSAALEYDPGRYATTDEVVALVEEIVPWGGVYIAHQRSEGSDPMWWWPSLHDPGPPTLLDSVRETIEIGERTGGVVVASHIKAKGANYFGSSHAAIRLIERARARGVQIYADQYYYTSTGSDGNTNPIPSWIRSGERRELSWTDALRAVLADPGLTADLEMDVTHEIARRGGGDQIVILEHPVGSYVARNLQDLADERGISTYEMALELQFEGDPDTRSGGLIRGFSLSEYDIEAYAPYPWVATASDAGVALPGVGRPHARFYGTYPRRIREYAIERGITTVEDAVRSSTSLPAQILGLRDRGLVREGYLADLVVLDLSEIRDNATFFEPHQYPSGIDHVLVNGELVVEEGEPTWALPGRVLAPAGSRAGVAAPDDGSW
jgi:N-acyl-D-amino-acid deacylase